MAAKIIDGEAVAAKIKEQLKAEVRELTYWGRSVSLVAVQANDNPGSRIYVANQKKACEEIGLEYRVEEMSPKSTQEAIEKRIAEMNADPKVVGIILQMPVPEGCDARKLQRCIDYRKDVEGIHPANLGGVVYGETNIAPCTALGAFLLAKGIEDLPPSYDPLPDFAKRMIEAGKTTAGLYGKNVCVIGHSEIVGKPTALLFLDHFCTVTVCHIGTPPEVTKKHALAADILVVATGVPQVRYNAYDRAFKAWEKDQSKPKPPVPDLKFIKADMVKPGAAVIDIAINRVPRGFDKDGKPLLNDKGKPDMVTVGDVDFEAAKEVAGWITPVPGGVGPMTTAILLRNTVNAAKRAASETVSAAHASPVVFGVPAVRSICCECGAPIEAFPDRPFRCATCGWETPGWKPPLFWIRRMAEGTLDGRDEESRARAAEFVHEPESVQVCLLRLDRTLCRVEAAERAGDKAFSAKARTELEKIRKSLEDAGGPGLWERALEAMPPALRGFAAGT
ncbi:MAG: bifunctional 5,10-methylenetetrahydrofolate dehydrogenase/5,10-methenyltetrahydrofolate cyclohydrolase [Planctomycetota bacterium]|nr:bifunctional 5,10-methylenetetrahydrofolate dehydrogenase/5,10-methenyltetrahydrofolate cyclohydrolase [Planctomycetota bacterium]